MYLLFFGSTGQLIVSVYINDVWISTNLGVSWSISTSSASWVKRGYHSSVVIDSTIYLMGGQISTTSTATATTPATTTYTYCKYTLQFEHIYYYFYFYIFLVIDNDVWKSSNLGVSWSLCTSTASWSKRSGSSVVVFNNAIIIMGGYNGYYCK